MKAFLIALQFLSRIHLVTQTVWTNEDFGRSVVFFPVVGMLIGIFLSVVYVVSGCMFLPPYCAVFVVIAWLFITGGLHADGLMDTADGIFSGRTRERMLEILKDSCVGSNGVIAFFMVASLKICFLANMPMHMAVPTLLGVPAAARFGALISIFLFPYAREQGLGRAFVDYALPHTVEKAFLLALLPLFWCGFMYLVVLGAAIVISLVVNARIVQLLGGVTGDTYGAVIEVSEMVLLGISCVLSVFSVHFAMFSI